MPITFNNNRRNNFAIPISMLVALLTMPPQLAAQTGNVSLTLEQIMADPDWLGNAPENAFWGADSRTVYYQQKRAASELRDVYAVGSDAPSSTGPKLVPESEWSQRLHSSVVYDPSRTHRAYIYAGDVYVTNGQMTKQITRTGVTESDPLFLGDGNRIAFERNEHVFVHDFRSGLTEQITDIRFADDPDENDEFDVMKAHQQRLFSTLRKDKRDEGESRERTKSLYEADTGLPAAPVYMGTEAELELQFLSPNGRWMILVTQPASFEAGRDGGMSNYVTDSGYIESRTVRTRVGRSGRSNHSVWLLDLNSNKTHALDMSSLPGLDDDPLEDLRENATDWHVDRGQDREAVEKLLEAPEIRDVEVWRVQWSPDGSQAALYVHANDNKDRWIATVDFDGKKIKSQHRMSDEAWVNPYHTEFGWLNDNRRLWFMTEDHGYLGIYTKAIDERRSKALVVGQYVAIDPQPGPSGRYIYYRANVGHPGIYEIWRVDVETGNSEQLTNLGGMNFVAVSPDESLLLITHSEINRHPDLFVQENRLGAVARRLTDTMSEEFKAIPWIEPDIVKVPSSHSDDPIYTKIYLPKDHDSNRSYPAVMFVHGAGYTQNSDFGWPYYFREGMFHNLLTQHGYVVIDMDYRASQGYGRDWRTAIYRRMGHPELEDFQDGVDYIIEHYGVDRNRVGVYGGSYGGFMTFMAMFRAPGLFQAGAGLRPVTDWSHYNHGYTSNILNTPDIDPEAYQRSSPIEFADGLEDPLLIAVGMQDDNVFFQDSVLLVQRLIELKKEDFEIAVYPLDPHSFVHAESWLDEYRRIFKLFETNLK